MIIRELKPGDIDYISTHSINSVSLQKQPPEIEISATLEHDGVPLAIGGIVMINMTTAWVWLGISAASGEYIYSVYRHISKWLDKTVREKGLKRLQAYVEQDFEEGHTFLRHLGFEFEAVMKNFIGEKSADLYRRFY